MKTLIAFCQKTGRQLRRFIDRQISKLTRSGQFKISVSIAIPLIAKIEVSYEVKSENPKS